MYYVYVMKSLRAGKKYTVQTNNIESRSTKHNKGVVKSTKNRKPFKLVFKEEFISRKDAINRETYLKSLKGGNEFKKIVSIHCGVVQW